MHVTSKSSIFYDMRRQCLNNRALGLALAVLALVALAVAACNGDSSPDGGSPSPGTTPNGGLTPVITPGSGASPAQAVGTYIDANTLDGYELDLSKQTECPLEPAQTVVAGTPTIVSRVGLGQFCLAAKDWEPDKAITVIVDLPDSGESWEMKLEFDSETSLWTLKHVKKISG